MSTRPPVLPSSSLPGTPEAPRAATTGERGAPVFRRGKLDAFAHLMGTMADAEVARLAGSSVAGVKAHRARHGITRWPGEPEGRRPHFVPAIVVRARSTDERPRDRAAAPAARRAAGAAAPSRPGKVHAAQLGHSDTVASPRRAFVVEATSGSGKANLVVAGTDIVSAARAAEALLALRAGGPWALRSVGDVGEAG